MRGHLVVLPQGQQDQMSHPYLISSHFGGMSYLSLFRSNPSCWDPAHLKIEAQAQQEQSPSQEKTQAQWKPKPKPNMNSEFILKR